MGRKKVLIIKLGAIGDIVHTSVIATAIKQKHPDWTIDFLTSEIFIPLIENHPHIDNIIPWKEHYRKTLRGFLEITYTLFKNRYDFFFSPTSSLRTRLFSILTFPKKSVFRKKLDGLWVLDYFQMAKKVISDIELPEQLVLGINPEINNRISEELKNYPKPHIIIAPGRVADNTRQGRLWNIKKWKELTQMLTSKYGGTIFVIGSQNERKCHETLIDSNIIIKSGDYALNESNALISNADLMISGDTGPVHIASAFGIKALALLGSTSPKHIKPYGKNGHYISAEYDCLYCWEKRCKKLIDGEKYTPCMEALSVDRVIKKVEEIF